MACCAPRLIALCLPLALVVGCGGTPAPESLGTGRQAVSGAATDAADPSDPAVVMVTGDVPVAHGGSGTLTIATGTIVSPHVVLTAADPFWGAFSRQVYAEYHVVLGNPHLGIDDSTWLTVQEIHFDPAYNDGLGPAHDIAVLILDSPTPVAPLPLNRAVVDSSWIGDPIRFVGYGATTASGMASAETARQGASVIDLVANGFIDTAPGGQQLCWGDWGAPGLVVVGGAEVVAGVARGGPSCSYAVFTRVDLYAPFIDQWIEMFDPPPGDGDASDGSAPDGPAADRDAADDAAIAPDAEGPQDEGGRDEAGKALADAGASSVAEPVLLKAPACGCVVPASPQSPGPGVWALVAAATALGSRRRRRAARAR